jgi:hypothetical protein
MNPNPTANQTGAAQPADDLDLLLQAHLASPAEHLTPSSGFVLSVMDTIQQQVTEPSPIAFPWRRALPGAIAVLCGLVVFLFFAFSRAAVGPGVTPGVSANPPLHLAVTEGATVLGSVLLASCISIVAVVASFRLAGRSR